MSYFKRMHREKLSRNSGKVPLYQDMVIEANEWIETAAYYIWLDEGCPEGRDTYHWDQAVQMFLLRPDH